MSETFALALWVGPLLLLAFGRLVRFAPLKGMRWTLTLLAVAALARWGVHLGRLGLKWEEWAEVGILVALGFLLARLVILLLFEWLLVQRVGVVMPRLARDVVALLLYVVVAVVVLHTTQGIDLGALLTTSAVVTVVIGFALQETLGTLLAGLTLAWERRFETGVWVEIDGIEGAVEELGWRSLILRTNLDERILIPNSQVARSRVKILGTGEHPVAFPIHVGVSYAAPPHAVKEVLLGVARDLPWVVDVPQPKIFTHQLAESSIVYECRVWTHEPRRHPDITDALLARAYTALARAGMEIPFPQRTLHVAPRRPPSDHTKLCREALAGCELFTGLPESALDVLASASRWQAFAPREAVVREGEESRALYVVAAGEAVVLRGHEEVARVQAGEVFGEMAFLSGAPRAATVRAAGALEVVEVDSHALRVLLSDHTDLMGELASRMEARQQELAARDELVSEQRSRRSVASFLLERLQRLVSG